MMPVWGIRVGSQQFFSGCQCQLLHLPSQIGTIYFIIPNVFILEKGLLLLYTNNVNFTANCSHIIHNSFCYSLPSVSLTLKEKERIIDCVVTNEIQCISIKHESMIKQNWCRNYIKDQRLPQKSSKNQPLASKCMKYIFMTNLLSVTCISIRLHGFWTFQIHLAFIFTILLYILKILKLINEGKDIFINIFMQFCLTSISIIISPLTITIASNFPSRINTKENKTFCSFKTIHIKMF